MPVYQVIILVQTSKPSTVGIFQNLKDTRDFLQLPSQSSVNALRCWKLLEKVKIQP